MNGDLEMASQEILQRLGEMLESRKGAEPDTSYVANLYSKGTDAILRKVGEEAVEVVLAAKGDDKLQVIRETADLWFHCLVMLAHLSLDSSDVLAELERREGKSGLEEKAQRLVARRNGE